MMFHNHLHQQCLCAQVRDLYRWDEAIDVLKKALELEPKSKEISAMLRDTMRKSMKLCILLLSVCYHRSECRHYSGSSEHVDKKREDSKCLKLVASDKSLPQDSRQSSVEGSGNRGAPLGFSEAMVEQFVRESLNSAIAQFAAQGATA